MKHGYTYRIDTALDTVRRVKRRTPPKSGALALVAAYAAGRVQAR